MCNKIKNFAFLHFTLLILALSFVFSKLASNCLASKGVSDFGFIVNLGIYVVLTAIYTLFWQLLLERFNLSFLYCNRAFHLIWMQVFAVIIFHNQITKENIIGLILIFIGVFINMFGLERK